MQYKTIVLELLQQHPQLHHQLCSQRMLLPTLNRYARQLRNSHLAWIDLLAECRPDSSASQLASEALEFAVQELEKALPSKHPPAESDPLSLDAAMAFITRHTPRT